MKRSRIKEPSSWGGLGIMCLSVLPLAPVEMHPALIAIAIACGAVGVVMRERQ